MKYSIYAAILAVSPLFFSGCGSRPSSNNTVNQNADSSVTAQRSDVQGNPSLQIIFPKGGEKLIKGKSYTFKWSGGDSVIAIFLVDSSLESKGASVSLTDRLYGIPNKGSYLYTFPARIQAGTYKVRIGKQESGYFKVVGKAVKQ